MFLQELSFPQTAPTDDAFFNWNWAGACGGCLAGPGLLAGWVGLQAPGSSGLRQDRYNAELQAPNVVFLCKNEKKGGSARASPMAAPMPKSDSS